MKVILVLNIPKDFDYRRCSIGGDGNIYYEREGELRTSIIGNIKNLRSLPQRLSLNVDLWEPQGYNRGYNDCLNEITGETE